MCIIINPTFCIRRTDGKLPKPDIRLCPEYRQLRDKGLKGDSVAKERAAAHYQLSDRHPVIHWKKPVLIDGQEVCIPDRRIWVKDERADAPHGEKTYFLHCDGKFRSQSGTILTRQPPIEQILVSTAVFRPTRQMPPPPTLPVQRPQEPKESSSSSSRQLSVPTLAPGSPVSSVSGHTTPRNQPISEAAAQPPAPPLLQLVQQSPLQAVFTSPVYYAPGYYYYYPPYINEQHQQDAYKSAQLYQQYLQDAAFMSQQPSQYQQEVGQLSKLQLEARNADTKSELQQMARDAVQRQEQEQRSQPNLQGRAAQQLPVRQRQRQRQRSGSAQTSAPTRGVPDIDRYLNAQWELTNIALPPPGDVNSLQSGGAGPQGGNAAGGNLVKDSTAQDNSKRESPAGPGPSRRANRGRGN